MSDNAGTNKRHYFYQDLLVANLIHKSNPICHIDIGSRVDGFVAHIDVFRDIKVLDIRHLEPSVHSNNKFSMLDQM